jgi:hypothetical protein
MPAGYRICRRNRQHPNASPGRRSARRPDHEAHARLRQVIAHRESGLTPADHDYVEAFPIRSSALRAERFRPRQFDRGGSFLNQAQRCIRIER